MATWGHPLKQSIQTKKGRRRELGLPWAVRLLKETYHVDFTEAVGRHCRGGLVDRRGIGCRCADGCAVVAADPTGEATATAATGVAVGQQRGGKSARHPTGP